MSKKIQLSLLSVAFVSSLHAQTVVNLDEIVVTSATKSKQSIKDVTSNINVITAEELEEKHFTSVTQALNTISGLNIVSNGGMGKTASVKLRGFDSKRVLVLIDGVRYNDITATSGAPFEHLMVSDIKQIEIIKGAQSGIWGADATAGVINIITKDAKKGFNGSVNAEYGSFNTKKYGITASYKTDNYYIKTSIQKVDSDGFSAQAPRGEDVDKYEDDGYENITSNIKVGFNINETNKIDISHTMIDAESEYDVSDANSNAITTTKDSFSKINFNHIDSFNEVDIYASKSTFDRDYPQGWTKEFDGEVLEYGLKSNISYNEKDFIIVGADYKNFEHKNDLKKEYNNKALFITNSNLFNCPMGGKMIATQSLRYDSYDKFENKTTAKLGIKRILNDDLSFSVNYATAYNVPTLYNLYAPSSAWGKVGNENLTPEDTTSYDISVSYQDMKITYFNSKIKDMIAWGNGYENIDGTSTIKGFEFEYAKDITEDIYLSTNYTHLSAKNKDNQVLARRAKNSFNAGVDYYGVNDLQLGLYAKYTGLRYDKENKQGEQTGRYVVADFVANYDVSKDLLVYLKIDNLFDKYYQEVDGYATAPLSGYVGFKAKF